MPAKPVVVYVPTNQNPNRIRAWLRRLLPAALLMVAPLPLDSTLSGLEGIVVDAEDGPLAVAQKVAAVMSRS